MLLKILKSALSSRPADATPSAESAPYSGAQRQGFIAFVANIEGPHFLEPGDKVDSDQASLRLRVSIPARELMRIAPVCLIPLDYVEHDPRLTALGSVRAIVIGKFPVELIAREPGRFLALADWAKTMAKDHAVVADFSDDLAAAARTWKAPALLEFQRRMAAAVALTAPSKALAERLQADAVHGVSVIEDPYEDGTDGEPRFSPSQPLKLVWFGVIAPGQAEYLAQQLGTIAHRLSPRPVELAMVTNSSQSAFTTDLAFALGQLNAQCAVRFVPWSRAGQLQEIARADLVLLPQDAASEWGAAKSHNRLVESLRAGRFAIASPIPAYLELREAAWVGEDLAAGVEWALANPAEVLSRITQGKRIVSERFAPARIAEKWAQALRMEGARKQSQVAHVRLNLGCGDKILSGYVNVDVAPSRAGRQPDVICDLHELTPFPNNSVDEVMAIHVVEHFWRWEVVDVLREWVRVLRPGGRMVIECPNLLTACEELLNNPEAGTGPGVEGQRTMWVFYGDPAWKDPLMCHRWNYTPASLAEILREAGLVNVRQEPAEFKLREPRDMRVVGEKAG